jgi:hypothetical protein
MSKSRRKEKKLRVIQISVIGEDWDEILDMHPNEGSRTIRGLIKEYLRQERAKSEVEE